MLVYIPGTSSSSGVYAFSCQLIFFFDDRTGANFSVGPVRAGVSNDVIMLKEERR